MDIKKKLFLSLGIFALIVFTINSALAFQGINLIFPISAAISLVAGPEDFLISAPETPVNQPYCSKPNGINYFTKDAINWGRFEHNIFYQGTSYDGCVQVEEDSTSQWFGYLREFYCDGSTIKWEEYKCPNGCDIPNGACKSSVVVTDESYCSKPNGINYFAKNAINWGRFEHNIFYQGTSYDGCVQVEENPSDAWFGYLREFYCDGSTIKWEEYKCLNGCDIPNGACKIADNTDTISPTVDITNPVDGTIYTSQRTSMTFNVNDANLHSCWYSLNGGANVSTSCSNGVNTINSITSVSGTNTWKVYAKDTSNNIGSDKVIFTVNLPEVDTTAPTVDITNPVDGTIYTSSRTSISFNVNDANLHSCWYSLNGGANISTPCVNGINAITGINSVSGTNTWKVYAKDTSNNIGSDKVIFTVSTNNEVSHPIDLIVINPKPGESLYCPLFLRAFSENATTMTYSLDGNSNILMPEASNNNFISGSLKINKGTHNVLFCASNAFNSTCVYVTFKVIEKSTPSSTCSNCNSVRVIPDYGTPAEQRNVIVLEETSQKQKLTFWQKIIDFFRNLFK